jgi:hypothetical protein
MPCKDPNTRSPGRILHGNAIDPSRAWQAMMAGEKPGGHGESCVAVGALDMAIWDAVAKHLHFCYRGPRHIEHGEANSPSAVA